MRMKSCAERRECLADENRKSGAYRALFAAFGVKDAKSLFSMSTQSFRTEVIIGKERGQEKMRRSYPSDISKEQFEKMRGDLTGGKKITDPFQYDLYDIFCTVLYPLKEGCTW